MSTQKPEIWTGLLRSVSFRLTAWGVPAQLMRLLAKFGLNVRNNARSQPLIHSVPLYRQGKAHYEAGDYLQAKTLFEQLVQLVPTNGGAWYYLARIDWIASDFVAAQDKFQRAVQTAPENANAKTWLIRAQNRIAKLPPELRVRHESADDVPDASPYGDIDLLEFAEPGLNEAAPGVVADIRRMPQLPELGPHGAQAQAARQLLQQGEAAAALAQFEAVFKEDVPTPFLAAFADTMLKVALSQKEALRRAFPFGINWNELGRLAAKLDAAGEAQAAFALRRTAWLQTGKFDIVKDAVGALLPAGQGAHAVEFLRELKREMPWNKSVYLLLADVFLAQSRTAEAKKILLEGTRELPGEPGILIKLAKLFAESSRWNEAIKAWREAAEAAPNTPNIYIEIADCYKKSGQYEKAAQEYRASLRRQPDNERAYRGLSQSLRRLGRQHEAITVLRKLVEIAPRNFYNWHELIYTLARAEIEHEAVAALAKAEAVLGQDMATIQKLVRSAERALLTDEAGQLLERIIADQPDVPGPVLELARHYSRQGLLGQAEGAFQRALSLGVDPQSIARESRHIAHVRTLLGITGENTGLRAPEDIIAHIAGMRQALQRRRAVAGRVAIITTKLASGGAERQTAITAVSISARTDVIRGVSMHCLSLSNERGHDFYLPLLKDSSVEISEPGIAELEEALEAPELADHAELIRLLPADLAYMVATWTSVFLKERPEVVHAWQDSAAVGGALAAILAGVPRIILSTRNTRPDNKYRRWKRYLRAAYQAFHEAGIVILNNSMAGGFDYDDWLGFAPGAVRVVHNGVDFSRLDLDRHAASPVEIKARLGIPQDAMIMGGVFRLSGEKQPLLWVETAALVTKHFPSMHFVICGQGTMRNDILEHGHRLGIADRLHLPGNQRPIAPWYCAMDIFLLSSKKEGLPNVLLEAQYLGVPVVSTDVGGVREVMDNGVSGWTVSEQQAEMLAERIIHSLENTAWRRRAGAAGREYVEKTFSVETMCNRTLDVYGYGRHPQPPAIPSTLRSSPHA